MGYRKNENNHVILCGKVQGEFAFNHSSYGEQFYVATIVAERLSGNIDLVPILVSERLVDTSKDWQGRTVYLDGEMRSYNKWENGRSRVALFVFVRYFEECEDGERQENCITIDGYVCKGALYRESPMGRQIADMTVAVNRAYRKSDYIPCICWGRNALFAASLKQGDRVRLRGRIQSREYMKRVSEEGYEQRTAYEVSVSSLEVVPCADTQSD